MPKRKKINDRTNSAKVGRSMDTKRGSMPALSADEAGPISGSQSHLEEHPARKHRPDAVRSGIMSASTTKAEILLKKLRHPKGSTLEQLVDATGWQAHSVRGFLSGTVRKRLGLPLVTLTGKDGTRRYHISSSDVS